MEDQPNSSKERYEADHKPRAFRNRNRGNSNRPPRNHHINRMNNPDLNVTNNVLSERDNSNRQKRQNFSRNDFDSDMTENPMSRNGNSNRFQRNSHSDRSNSNSVFTDYVNTGIAYSSRPHRNNPRTKNDFNSDLPLAASNVCVYDEPVAAADVNSSRNFNQYPSQHEHYSKNRKGRYGSNPKPAQNNNTSKLDAKESQIIDVPCFNESYQYSDYRTDFNSASRGQIVGGRYVRKHSNQPFTHSQAYQQKNSENNIPSETYDDQFHSNSQRSRNAFSENSKRQNKIHSNNDQRRTLPEQQYSDNYSRRKAQYNSSRLEENSFASSDVYHYSSQNAHSHKSFKPTREYNGTSASSDLSSYKENEATQRELLIQQLNKGECECLVCCDQIMVKDHTWHCLSCYHVFHLRCIRKWARSPTAVVEDGGWRCPACQSLTDKVPYDYFCFCGKHRNPDVNYHLTPHSCGEVCQRKRPDCSHHCKELCHPGPCPPCSVVVQKSCACGKTFKTTSCNHSVEETCTSVCGKTLNCGAHSCKKQCHPGECLPCEETIDQNCFCGKNQQTVACTQKTVAIFDYSCGSVCGKQLKCGHHSCNENCHPGECKLCSLSTQVVKTCPCGKSTLETLVASGIAMSRKSCLDPIPVCNAECDKILSCGSKDKPHRCQSSCHEGECPSCLLVTSLKCRCGAFTKEFNCADITPAFVYLCEKRCNRRKDCGRHKCLNNCCINIEHKCELICNKKLSCGNHQCQETCHMGNCPTCWNVSFDELRCHCGESVLYPPVHCGTKPPECTKPCTRIHSCEHAVKHVCHSEETCPPCTFLTVKWCYGNHKQCSSVMCFMDGVSCGMPCLKDLPCGSHKCKLTCHPGPCLKPQAKCTQACLTPRSNCGHPCGNLCHEGSCPDTPCKSMVTLTCPCGHRSETTTCHDSTKSYRLMSVSILASKMQEIKDGQSVNLNDVLGRKSKNNKLQCNEECAAIERNKRLAVALQIQNPDLTTSPGPPNYSDFLKSEAKKNPSFVSNAYDKISDLVQLAKDSKQKCRSYSFPPMNRDQRRVIHELAEFFGCETQSYDEEPKKNVVVTAYKTKCWLPFVNIMTVVQRDMGFRKGPTPLPAQRESKTPSTASPLSATNTQKKKIDYFDYN